MINVIHESQTEIQLPRSTNGLTLHPPSATPPPKRKCMTASHAIHVSIHTTVGLFRMVAFERRDLPPLGDEKKFFLLAPARTDTARTKPMELNQSENGFACVLCNMLQNEKGFS
ncbi:hypothetical protein KQX54_008347 [Cotesia glomerata]|uniref:Uncharacterized protein n=1 Tax=Cotesia glomerata TaxID=32391 RepID=A0AAV7HWB4_COTGL|nr:hypothetical protein KQX54_008347 [Cotesia glomerata]